MMDKCDLFYAERRVKQLKRQDYMNEMSDNFYYSSGRKDRMERTIREAEKTVESIKDEISSREG